MNHRVIAYVDGFNLYYGLKSKAWRHYYWLDVAALARSFLEQGQVLQATHYFTARIRDDGSKADKVRRQSAYIDALVARGVILHEGHFLEKTIKCRKCGAAWIGHEEKMTDVNIAAQLLCDGFDDAYDTALLISGDSDLTTPIRNVQSRFDKKRVVVLLLPNRHSKQLKKAAHGYLSIGEDKLRQSQLPNDILTPSGYILRRPEHWQ